MLTLVYGVYRLIIPDVTLDLDFSRAGDIACLDDIISIPHMLCLSWVSTINCRELWAYRLPPILPMSSDWPFPKMSHANCSLPLHLNLRSNFRTLGSLQKWELGKIVRHWFCLAILFFLILFILQGSKTLVFHSCLVLRARGQSKPVSTQNSFHLV